jgi:hypothetical protein
VRARRLALGSGGTPYINIAQLFEPQNTLERSLVAAATDPAARPQFYRDLVAADLLVIQEPDAPPQQLKIRPVEVNGHDCLPVFSSLPRLQQFVDHEVGYVAMNALEFMKITRGAFLLLNPGSDYGKEFLPEEIASILDGTIWQPQSSYTAERDTQVLLGQPARYPAELVDVLGRVFAKFDSVRAAYLAHFFNPAQGDKPHTLIAIEAADHWEQIAAEAGMAANGVNVPDPPVDFVRLPSSGLDSYFQNVEPFYRRA